MVVYFLASPCCCMSLFRNKDQYACKRLSASFSPEQLPFHQSCQSAPHSGKHMVVAKEEEGTTTKKPKRRVVVTGVGVVSPIGHDPDMFYTNLLQGISGITQIDSFDCSEFPTRFAGEIREFSTDGWVAPKISKRADKFIIYTLTAGKKALADGGITEDLLQDLDKFRCGVLVGSALGGMKGWMGPSYSISTACATSSVCILSAANHIIRGEADMMLCGGSDSAIIPICFTACRVLSRRNSDPTRASRPWDVDRGGFVIGEGSGVLLLEELEHAKKRKAKIYAELLGGSFTSDAYHMIEPHPEGKGVVLCIEKALAQYGVKREDVNYINAHAASTPAGDLIEYQAILHCFGENPEVGYLLEMNGLVGSKKEHLDSKVALSNSFGFGGQNSSILFAPYKNV
ncbi:unnamed protein product [Withania somnifera]